MQRRSVLKAGIAMTSSTLITGVRAQTGSGRVVRVIVPFTAGGPADMIARKLADLMAPDVGRTIVVENKPGAAGVIAVQEVMRSDPDGSTLGLAGPDALISGPLIVNTAKYDARTDVVKLMQVSYAHQVIWAHSSVGATTLTELIARAKAQPGSIAAVSWGPGSRAELVFKSLETTYGIKFTNVPYRGIPQAMTDLAGGSVHLAHLPPNAALQLQDKGLGVAIAVLGADRAPELPKTLSSQEQGVNLPLLNARMWNMAFGPKNMPADVSRRWVEALRKATATDAFKDSMRTISQIPMTGKFGEVLDREFAAEAALVTEVTGQLNIKPG